MLDYIHSEKGISPVIGVVLMVAITVTLAGVVGFILFDIGNSTESNAQAGVQTQQTAEGVQIQIIESGNVDKVNILVDDSKVTELDESSRSTTIEMPKGAEITVIGVTKDGEQTILSSSKADIDTTTGNGVRVVSGAGLQPEGDFYISFSGGRVSSVASNGTKNWDNTGVTESPNVITSSGNLYVSSGNSDGGERSKVRRLATADGTTQWTKSWCDTCSFGAGPDGFGGVVAGTPDAYAYNESGGNYWTVSQASYQGAAALPKENVVYTYDYLGPMRVVDASTGNVIAQSGNEWGLPQTGGKRAYYSNSNTIYAMDSSLNEKWRKSFSKSYRYWAAPDGDLFVQFDDGTIKEYSPSGSLLMQKSYSLDIVHMKFSDSGTTYMTVSEDNRNTIRRSSQTFESTETLVDVGQQIRTFGLSSGLKSGV